MYIEKILIANWDGIFQPRSASPRQILAALFSFAELYTYQWQGLIYSLPKGVQPAMRLALAATYIPKAITVYQSTFFQKLLAPLKTGLISESDFFTQLLDTQFSFLRSVEHIEVSPLELIKHAWLYPRIQALTSREEKRLQQVLNNFDKIILVANTNVPDIRAFIQNLLLHPSLTAAFVKSPALLNELENYKRNDTVQLVYDDVVKMLWELGDKVGMLTSVQAGKFKVQTGPLAQKTNSDGFLSELLKGLGKKTFTFISEADADLNHMRRAQNVTIESISTGRDYFKDVSKLNQWQTDVYDNWPALMILLITIVFFYFLIHLTSTLI